jgi:hypothetical protein
VPKKDLRIMGESLKTVSNVSWHPYAQRQFDCAVVLVLTPGVCEALNWSEGDQIAFRKLFSGELLTYTDTKVTQADER